MVIGFAPSGWPTASPDWVALVVIMKPQTFYSQKALVDAGEKLAADASVVSFDMFDTLLVRRTHNPDLIKIPVARFISVEARARGLDWDWRQVQTLRDSNESEMRADTGRRFEDQEACYPVFMKETLSEIFGPAGFGNEDIDNLLQRVTDYEMALENAMLVPRATIVNWLKSLRAAGKKILVISDIYLPAGNLRGLLAHAGILDHVETVISSADSFLAKASGMAYHSIAAEFEIKAGDWLHVGDNPVSDGFRPGEVGIRSLVLQDPEEFRRRAIAARQYFYSNRRSFWKGRALQQMMAPLEAENLPRSPMYVEGYNFLGPLICMYVHRVAELCRERKIGKLFFLSREGWMFKQVWEKITPLLYPDRNLPQIEYLYVSRQALAGASCAWEGLTQEKADIVFLPQGNCCFRDVCRVFRLDPGSMESHLQRYELTLDSILTPAHLGFSVDNRRNFERLIRDQRFQQEVRSQSENASRGLIAYLESVGLFDYPEVALADVGWLGTIQRFLHSAIKHRPDKPVLNGMLLGASRGIPFPTDNGNFIEGLLFDRDRFDFASSAILYARDLFEEACRAPYPTLNAYVLKDDGNFELQFRQMDDAIGQGEQRQDRYYADLQQAVLDAAGRYAAASVLVTEGTAAYRPWINYLMVSKLAFPRRREINAIQHIHHLDDFHGSNKPRRARRPKLIHNPWEVSGWKQRFAMLTRGSLFRKHLKAMINGDK